MSVDAVDVATAHKVRMADLARLAGVSVATVSRSLNDSPLINRTTKSRVWQVACDHGYATGHTMPEALREVKKTVAVMVPFGGNRDHQAVIHGLITAARDMKCNLLFSHLGPNDHKDLAAVLEEKDADAFVFLGDDGLAETLNAMAEHHRLVVWGGDDHEALYDCAGPDNFACGTLATRHLASLGCRRIAWLGDMAGLDMQQSFMGYLTALNAAGLPFDPNLVVRELPVAEDDVDAVFIADEPSPERVARAVALAIPVVAYSRMAGAGLGLSLGLATVSIDTAAAGRELLSRLLRQDGGQKPPVERFAAQLNI